MEGYCSLCGEKAVPGRLECVKCGARVRAPLAFGSVLLLLAAAWALAYGVALAQVRPFLAALGYLQRVFATHPRLPGVPTLVYFDQVYVFIFWPLVLGTLGAVIYGAVRAKKLPPRAPSGWSGALLTGLVGCAALGAVALQFIALSTYNRVLPDVLTLLPDHLAFRGLAAEQAGRLDVADALLRRAVETTPQVDKARRDEMARLYDAFLARHKSAAKSKAKESEEE
jgi:hypothetical protein